MHKLCISYANYVEDDYFACTDCQVGVENVDEYIVLDAIVDVDLGCNFEEHCVCDDVDVDAECIVNALVFVVMLTLALNAVLVIKFRLMLILFSLTLN